MGALLSFLGGSAFRMIWGEVSSFFAKRQDHKFEIERMKLQNTFEAEQHARNLEAQRLQVELGHKTIAIQADADVSRSEAEAFRALVAEAQRPTGITFIDAWNGSVRPAFATWALIVLLLVCFHAGWEVPALHAAGILDVVYVVIGFYFADRSLRKRGK